MRLSLFGQGNQVNMSNVPSEGTALEQSLKNGAEQISSKLPGETVTGTVVGKNGYDLLISIGKDQMLQARLDNNMQIDIGKAFTFSVKSSLGNKVTLSPLFTNLTNDPNISKALQMAGIPETDVTASMVKTMMQEGMPIDKNSLHQMIRSINLNPSASVDTLVQMTRLQIPITEENIYQFEAYKNYEHQLSEGINTIADSLPETTHQLNATGNTAEAINLYKELFSLFSEEQISTSEHNTINSVSVNPENTLLNTLQEPFSLNGESLVSPLGLNSEETLTLSENLKQAGFTELGEAVFSNQINKTDLILAFKKILAGESLPVELNEKMGRLLESDEINKFVKQEMKNQWMLSPEEVAEENKVEELYQKLNSHLTKLSQTAEQNASQSPFTKAVNTMSGNIDFMNHLNQLFTYVQIPLKMQGQEASGELYVYTNKKNLAKEDGAVSALLHLDMEHLGSVNVHVSMKEQNVSTKFYLQDDSTLDLIADHIDILNERLNKRGYRMSASFSHQDENLNVMEEMIKQDKNISILSGYSFDARA